MLQNVASSTKTQIHQKCRGQVKFEMHMSTETVPSIVKGDTVRILQILYNLLSNAAKFTAEGYIHLNVDACIGLEDAVRNGFVSQRKLKLNDNNKSRNAANKKPANKAYTNDDSSVDEICALKHCSSSHSIGVAVGGPMAKSADDSGFYMNLLQNAEAAEEGRMEHSKNSNGTTGSLAGKEDEVSNETVVIRIEVEDTGDGIEPDRLPHIFVPYASSKLSNYRKHGGTGLGMFEKRLSC